MSAAPLKNPVYIIAEVGLSHDGSLGIAHSYIDALATTGVDAIKFQIHDADAESSVFEPFRIPFSYQDHNRQAYWKRTSFNLEQWKALQYHALLRNMDFIASPFSISAVEIIRKLELKIIKIGSAEITNHLLLQQFTDTDLQLILSSGMSNWNELDQAIGILKPTKNKISLLQCTSAYPTTPLNWGLNVMAEYKNRYQIPVGFSDHSGEIFTCLAAVSLGAEYIEFHVTFDKRMFGPDAKSSLTISQVSQLVQGIRQIQSSLQNPVDKDNLESILPTKTIFEKSIAVNKDLPKNHVLRIEDLESKKPANIGIHSSNYQSVIGRKLNKPLQKWNFITPLDMI
jgi:N,N'-diacetyllegionaminate synthase